MISGSNPRIILTLLILFIGINLLSFSLGWSEYLQYQHQAINRGQLWRLVSAHWVHMNAMHFLINLFALLVLWQLSAHWLSTNDKLLVLLGSMLLIGCGLYLLFPQIAWYRGLSGALHAFWLAIALLGLKRDRLTAIILLLVLLLKLGWEIAVGPTPLAASLSGGPVLLEAHWLGAGAGLIMVFIIQFLRSFK